MIKPDLTTLRIFLAVHRIGSIGKAAEHEHIAPSAISKRIRALEAEFGAALFYRHAHGVTATAAGNALARHALALFDDVNQMTSELGRFVSGVSGQVRIYAHTSAVVEFLPQEVTQFLAKHGDVEILLREESRAQVIQSTVDGLTDIGIFAGNMSVPQGLEVFRYRRDRLVALVPVAHPLATRSAIRFADTRDCNFISLAATSSLQILLNSAARSSGFELKTRIEVKTFEAAIRMVQVGLGITVVPEGVLKHELAERPGCAVSLTDPWADRWHLICVRSGQRLTASAALMLDQLRSHTAKVCPLKGGPA